MIAGPARGPPFLSARVRVRVSHLQVAPSAVYARGCRSVPPYACGCCRTRGGTTDHAGLPDARRVRVAPSHHLCAPRSTHVPCVNPALPTAGPLRHTRGRFRGTTSPGEDNENAQRLQPTDHRGVPRQRRAGQWPLRGRPTDAADHHRRPVRRSAHRSTRMSPRRWRTRRWSSPRPAVVRDIRPGSTTWWPILASGSRTGVFTYEADAVVLTGDERDRVLRPRGGGGSGLGGLPGEDHPCHSRRRPPVGRWWTERHIFGDGAEGGPRRVSTGARPDPQGGRRIRSSPRRPTTGQLSDAVWGAPSPPHRRGHRNARVPGAAVSRARPRLWTGCVRSTNGSGPDRGLRAVLSEEGADPLQVRAEVERLAEELENHLTYEEEQLIPILDVSTP